MDPGSQAGLLRTHELEIRHSGAEIGNNQDCPTCEGLCKIPHSRSLSGVLHTGPLVTLLPAALKIYVIIKNQKSEAINLKEELIREEEKRMRRLRSIINLTEAVLTQSGFSLPEALQLMENTKKAALSLFPDKEFVYDLVYTPRFRRILEERFTIPGSLSGMN
jgi:hypothetical protein